MTGEVEETERFDTKVVEAIRMKAIKEAPV